MKDKIKKRLAQIRAGKIPEGYKKGKIGIVPDDWEEIIFSELFTSTSEYTDDLAAENEILKQDSDFSIEYCDKLCDEVWGGLWE